MSNLAQNVARWVMAAAALLVIGPVLAMALGRVMHAGDGGPHATALVSSSPVLAMLSQLVIVAIACVAGVAASRVADRAFGVAVAGLTLVAPAWVSGETLGMLRWAEAPGMFWRLAIEALLIGAVAAAGAWLIRRVGRCSDTAHAAAQGLEPHNENAARTPAIEQAVGFILALVAGGAAAWLIAREPTKGQALLAGVAGGIAGAAAARAVAPRVTIVTLVAALMTLAVLGPIGAAVLQGAGAQEAAYAGRLFGLARLVPMDWLAGGLVGAPIGIAWTRSVTVRHAGAPRPA